MVNFSYIEEAYSYKDNNNEKPKKTKKIIQQPQPIVYNYPIDNKTKEETEKALQTSLNPPTYNNNDELDTYLNLGFYNNNNNNNNNNQKKQIAEPQINKCLKDLKEMFNNQNENKNENKNENNIKIDINLFNLFLFIFLGIIIIILIDQITKIAIYKAT